MDAFFSGLGLGLSLIVAIGAQNAFVLRQGLRREHVFWVCLTCALSDAILISFGVLGFGYLTGQVPWLEEAMRYGGAVFLLAYGARSLWAALTREETLSPSDQAPSALARTLLICLAFTWLNPHVYLDTVVVMGSVSTQFAGASLYFLAGAVSGSFLFFFSLGYGAALLIPLFQKPLSWRILDGVVALLMWSIAYGLLTGGLG